MICSLPSIGGLWGRRLLTCVSDVMRTGDEIPTVKADADFSEVLIEMTGKTHGDGLGR